MSEQTKYSAALRVAPNQSKKPSNVAALTFASDPQQTLAVAVDLIDQRQVALPAATRELVDADGLDVREVAVREAPVDRHAHGPIDGVPGRGERRGDLLPRQALGPPGEEPGVGVGQSVLAGGPRNGLDLDAAARAGHAAHRVEEDHRDVPQGHEVEAPRRQRVVARGRAPAVRARRAGPGGGDVPGPRGSAAGAPPAAPSRRRTPSASAADSSIVLSCIPFSFRVTWVLQHQIVADSGTGCVSAMSRPRSVIRDGVVAPPDAGVGIWSSSDKSRDERARSRRPGRQPRAAGAERSDAP